MIKGKFSIVNRIKCQVVIFGFFSVIFSLKINGQPPQAVTQSYISLYAAEAIDQMIKYKIPASVTLAQAIFESHCGNSLLAQRSNNHFGIKCHTQWGGDTIRKSDDSLDECFRKYNSIQESYADHSRFLATRERYRELFKLPVSDYKGWCKGLKTSGYATYAYYTEVLIKIIEENRLYEFDGVDYLTGAELISPNKSEIITSNLTGNEFTLEDLSVNDLLWNDERDILIQSLEMIISTQEKEDNYPVSLPSGILICSNANDITDSKLVLANFTLKELCANDLLWNDEKYVLIQSLEMIIDHPEKETALFVEK